MRGARAAAVLFLSIGLLLGMLVVSGCGELYPSVVRGTATYTGDLAVPPDATLKIEMVDVTRQDVPPSVIAEQLIQGPGNPPIAFEVNLNPQEIDANHTYFLVASISDANGELLYASTQPYPLFTQGNSSQGVELVMYQLK
jgi:putative lipoprotein